MISLYDFPSNMEDSEILTEETMINPHTPLPSFLEMCLIDSTTASGQAALSSSLEALVSFLSPLQTSQQTNTNISFNMISRIKYSLAKFLSRYTLEIQALITYFMEKHCLISKATGTGGGTIGESVYGAMRSKVVPVIHIPSTNQSVQQDNKHHQNLMALLPMTQKDCIRSAFFMAFAPYIKNKLEKYYNDLKRTNLFESEDRNSNDHQHERDHMNEPTLPFPQFFFSSNTNANTNMRKRIQKLLYILYPYLHMTHQGTLYYYQLSYLLGNTIYYSPYLAFLKVMVRRVTITDRERNRLNSKKQNNNNHPMENKANVNSSSNKLKSNAYNSSNISPSTNITSTLPSTPSLSSSLGKVNHNGSNTNIENNHSHVKSHSHRHAKKNDKLHIAEILRSTVLITLASVYLGACFMKLREEQRRIRRRHRILSIRRNQSRNNSSNNNEDNNTIETNLDNRMNNIRHNSNMNRNDDQQNEPFDPSSSMSIPVPPPPQQPTAKNQYIPSQNDQCPLCKNEFVNPTASCSGYVFCYRCLVQYLREVKKECPVSKRFCRESDIIRIYEST